MKNTKILITIFFVFLGFVGLYYFSPLAGISDKTFITTSTFVFAIFSGFFISRQGSRYNEIRKSVSSIDGNFSSIYRLSGHLGFDVQEKIGQAIKAYYQNIITSKIWNYNFINKTSTLTDVHNILGSLDPKKISPLSATALSVNMRCLSDIQIERKRLIAMCEERIPVFQWITTYFLSLALIFTLLVAVPSRGLLAESFLKAVFSISIVIVMILLKKLDSLKLFGGIIGEHSARDVVDIIEDRK